MFHYLVVGYYLFPLLTLFIILVGFTLTWYNERINMSLDSYLVLCPTFAIFFEWSLMYNLDCFGIDFTLLCRFLVILCMKLCSTYYNSMSFTSIFWIYISSTSSTLNLGQNKKGHKINFLAAPFFESFFSAASWKKGSKIAAAKNFFGPSYFVMALVSWGLMRAL